MMAGTLLAGGKWLSFQNRSNETVPPFGVMRISGSKIPNDGEAYLYCDRPDNYGSLAATVINGAVAVQPQGYGGCTRNWPAFAAFDDRDGEPEPGQIWGPVKDSFRLRKYAPGFLIVAEPQLEGTNRGVLVLPDFTTILRVKMDATIDEGEEKKATILRFNNEFTDEDDMWIATELKKDVILWGCSAITTGIHCTAMQLSGKWFVTKACC